MKCWDVIREEASIVLVGNMNPKIFHPEWFIRKQIVEEWDYSKDEIIGLPDMAQMELPNERKITVFLNKFMVRSLLASEHFSISDLVINTFTLLRETPISQMGMNFSSVVKFINEDSWRQFGKELAPQHYWEQATNYINLLEKEKKKNLGLWELIMNLPRPDDLEGFVRPKIAVFPEAGNYALEFSVNNHVEVKDSSAITMTEILVENWDKSLSLANELTMNILKSQ